MAYWTIVVPLRLQDNLLSVTDPFELEVWICFLICIPAYIMAIIFMNYLYSGSTKWEAAFSSVIRSVLSERKSTTVKPPKQMHQKLLVLVWSWMMVVLISAYKGNLLAMITKPAMNTPFADAKGMVEQDQMKWGWDFGDDGLFAFFAKSQPLGTTLRKIYDEGILTSLNSLYCHSIVEKSRCIAAICDISGAIYVTANDFSKTGACNYYLTEDRIFAIDQVLAFPVSITLQAPCYVSRYKMNKS